MKYLMRALRNPGDVYYGWWIVGIAFFCHMFIFGVPTIMLPLVYGPIIEEFGWSRGEVMMMASLKFGSGVLAALVIGYFADTGGVRRMMVITSLIVVGCMWSFLLVQELWHLYIIGFVIGLGSVGILLCVKILISRWFHERQGLALGIALLGLSIAGTFLPVILDLMIEAFGWRMAIALLSIGIIFFSLPLFLIFAKDSPEEMGLAIDGKGPAVAPGRAATPTVPIIPGLPESFRGILSDRTFWLVAAGIFLIAGVDQALIQNTILFLQDVGLSSSRAALGISIFFATGIIGKVFFGWIFDKMSVRGVMIAYIGIALGTLLAFPVAGLFTLFLFTSVRGLAHGGTAVDIPLLAKHCYGPVYLGKLIGLLTAVATAGMAIGPSLTGYMWDYFGSYNWVFVGMIGLSIVAALLLLGVRPLYREYMMMPARAAEPQPERQPATT